MKKLSNLYLAFVFIVLYLPIFYLIGYAFNAGDDMNSFTGFSLSHFETMFGDGRLMLILVQTFLLAFLSALIATVIGTFGAIYIYQSRKKYQEAFLSLTRCYDWCQLLDSLYSAQVLSWFSDSVVQSRSLLDSYRSAYGLATIERDEWRYDPCSL